MRSFWRLLAYIKNYKLNIVLSIVSNVLMAGFTVVSIPAVIPFLQILFDRVPQQERLAEPPPLKWNLDGLSAYLQYHWGSWIDEVGKDQMLLYVCFGIVLLFFMKNLFRYLSLFFMAPVRNGIVRDLRKQLFEKVIRLPIGYFTEQRKGDLLSRITADVQEIEWSILNVLEAIFREPLVIAGGIGFMVFVSPSLTLFVFLLLIFTAVIIGGIGKTLKKSSSKVQERLGQLVTTLEEALGGLRIIKGFNAEAYQEKKFATDNDQYRRLLTRLLWRRDLSSPLSEFLGIAVVAMLLWYGSRLVFSGDLQAETFFAFLFAFYNVLDPAKKFSTAYYNIQKGIAAIQRVEVILDARSDIVESPNALAKKELKEGIEYRNVFFQYPNSERWVLENVSLNIPRGKILALVGSSGAGKSTLTDLLPRFYDALKGEIAIDGINIQDLKIHDLRNLMGIVSQEAVLFNDTIYNNIVFGQKNVDEQDVIAAAKIANAHAFILESEKGYQTVVGDRGSRLSGGQRQRITIARAILRNPPILILDEATSSLDSESERLVQDALNKLMQNRTAIVIAHRLSTIQHADEIVVLDQGRVVERGTHEELIRGKGVYHKLVELQAF
jgi:ABC-type multidrug transport system fused ATPase/permease subunit